jgi:hypothetical protein
MTTHPADAPRGIRLSVLRSAHGDCTNGGITSDHVFLTLVGDGVPPLSPASPAAPAVTLTETMPGYKVLVPADQPAHLIGPMAGGSYAVGQYGREGEVWRQLAGTHGALPVHDRFETQEHYDALSR